MPEKVLQSLESFEYLMLAICTVGVLLLLAKSYNVSVSKEGMDFARGHNTRFGSIRDDGGAAVGRNNYEGLRAHRRNYEGMLGANEPPVFWGNAYSEAAAGQAQAAGLDEDNSDGDAWTSAHAGSFQHANKEGAVRRRRTKEGMLDAALAGDNVTPRVL
jgi:hypothetical protein